MYPSDLTRTGYRNFIFLSQILEELPRGEGLPAAGTMLKAGRGGVGGGRYEACTALLARRRVNLDGKNHDFPKHPRHRPTFMDGGSW